jgi:hypothetical protein
MGYDQKQLKDPTKSLYGFDGKRIEPVGVITLPVLFGNPQNPSIEYIIFMSLTCTTPIMPSFEEAC